LSENERIIHDFLKASDFPSFLKRNVGGNKSSKAISATLLHCSRFLVWSFRTKFSSTLLPSQGPEWISIIIKREYLLLDAYCDYLMTTKGNSASTVANYISSILTAVKWFVVYTSTARTFRLDSTHLFAINTAAKALKKSAAKTAKRDSMNKTVEKSIADRQWPVGGLAELQSAISSRMAWARLIEDVNIDKSIYNQFLGLLMAAMYVYSVQGRLSGVSHLTLGDAQTMLTDGFTTNTNFKTQKTYGLQPISIDKMFGAELLEIYLQKFRSISEGSPESTSPESPLWVDISGSKYSADALGRFMTAFFNKSLNLHITSTTIRSLMETHADKMMKRGEITEEERTAVMTINGHSSSTTRNYYIRQDRAANVRNSRAIFGRVPETENTQSRSVSTDTGNNNLLQLGQENDRSSSDNGDDFFEMDLDSNHQPLPVHQFVRFFTVSSFAYDFLFFTVSSSTCVSYSSLHLLFRNHRFRTQGPWSQFSSPLNGDVIIQILIPGRRGFVGQSMRYYILKYTVKNSLL
jgi:hypothetical protein